MKRITEPAPMIELPTGIARGGLTRPQGRAVRLLAAWPSTASLECPPRSMRSCALSPPFSTHMPLSEPWILPELRQCENLFDLVWGLYMKAMEQRGEIAELKEEIAQLRQERGAPPVEPQTQAPLPPWNPGAARAAKEDDIAIGPRLPICLPG